VVGYRRIDKKRNTDIRQDLNILNIREKIKEYQQKYFKHILRTQNYRIPQRMFNYHNKKKEERGHPLMRWKEQFT
jgi:hypothetical protein